MREQIDKWNKIDIKNNTCIPENLVDDIGSTVNQWRNAESIGYTYGEIKLDPFPIPYSYITYRWIKHIIV